MLFKNAIQKIHVYAYDSTTGAAKTGDAANITAYVSLDGTANAVDDTNPAEVDATNMPGVYVFDLTAAETNCNSFALIAKSTTANIRLVPIVGFTVGADAAIKVDATKIAGTTQTAGDLLGVWTPTKAGYLTGAVALDSTVAKEATLATTATYIDTEVAAIKAKTDNLPTDPADQSAVEAAITAATSPLATAANLATVAGYLDTEIASILGYVDCLPALWVTVPTAAENASQVRTELTTELGRIDAAVSSRSSHAAADVKTALEADGSKLDHLWEMTEDDAGVRRLTTNALEQAASGGLDAAGVRAAIGMAAADLDTQLDALVPGTPVNIQTEGENLSSS